MSSLKVSNGLTPVGTNKPSTPYTPTKRKLSYLFQPQQTTTPNGKHKLSVEAPQKHHRKSSIQVNFLESEKGQLEALNRELEFLKKEIPNFQQIFTGSEIQFKSSKKNKVQVLQFSMIQALSSWISTYGKPSYVEYNEFKEDAEYEMLSLVEKLETLKIENEKLNIVIQSLQSETNELHETINNKTSYITKLENDLKDLKANQETNEIKQLEISELTEEYNKTTKIQQELEEKNERLTKYLKVSQSQNDELSNKNYKLEDEISRLKKEKAMLQKEMLKKDEKYKENIKELKLEHEKIEKDLKSEQEKLIVAAQAMDKVNDNYKSSMVIDAEDDDIPDSNINDENESFDHTTVINSLANEFEEYEFEDEDAWLNESDQEEYIPPDEPEEEEEIDPSSQWEDVKQSHYQEPIIKENNWEMETKTIVNENVKDDQFESSSKSLTVGLLSASDTDIVKTPTSASPVKGNFEAETLSLSNEQKSMEFSSSKIKMSQKNELVKPVTKPIFRNMKAPQQGPRIKKAKVGGLNGFEDILNKWKKDEKEKGGKPQVKFAREYIIKNRWVTSEKQLQGGQNNAKKEVVKATDPQEYKKQNQPKLNMHRKMTIIKKSKKFLKPRFSGYLQIIQSKFIKDFRAHSWQKEAPKFYFVLDALPSKTNTNAREPDFVKKKVEDDFLVPALFFFVNKKTWDKFYQDNAQVAVRELAFQKSFSSTAKGVFPLHEYCVDKTQKETMKKVSELKKKTITLPQDQKDTKSPNDKTLYVCNQWESHRFHTKTNEEREDWFNKIEKLVSKRAGVGKKGTGNVFDSPNSNDSNTDFNNLQVRPSSQSVAQRLSVIKDVEDIFD